MPDRSPTSAPCPDENSIPGGRSRWYKYTPTNPPKRIHMQQRQLPILMMGTDDKTPMTHPPMRAGTSLLGVRSMSIPHAIEGSKSILTFHESVLYPFGIRLQMLYGLTVRKIEYSRQNVKGCHIARTKSGQETAQIVRMNDSTE